MFVKLLLEFVSLDVLDARDNCDETPLYIAISSRHIDIAMLLVDMGADVARVKIDSGVKGIPFEILQFVESRSSCCNVAITFIGIHQHRCTSIIGRNDISILKTISRFIWQSRFDKSWVLLEYITL